MREKHRNVSHDSSFHPLNKPPQQYLDQEKILEKPCKINLKGIDTKGIPLAGKLGALGAKIMADPLRAKHFTTGPWDVIQTSDHVPRSLHGKKPKPIAEKLGMIDIAARADETDNFQLLHRKLPPTSVTYQT
jgi:hypothetical protein